MHELSITQSVLDIALEAVGSGGARRITSVNLVVGTLTSIVDDSVQFYFEILSKGTLAEGAQLRFRREVALVTCGDCGHRTEVGELPLLSQCSTCGSRQLAVTGGRSFFVESIEVEDLPQASA